MSKRVLVVARSTSSHPGSGGMERQYEKLLWQMRPMGFDFALVTTPGGYDASVTGGIYDRVWHVGDRPGRYSLAWWATTTGNRGYQKWSRWNPDIIFSVSYAGAHMGQRRQPGRVPVLTQIHGTSAMEVQSALRAHSIRDLAKLPLNVARIARDGYLSWRSEQIVSVGHAVTNSIQRTAPWAASKIVTIPNGVHAEEFGFSRVSRQRVRQDLQIAEDSPVLLFSGRVDRQKGLDLVLRALAHSKRQDATLIVCGEGPELSLCTDLAVQLGLARQVKFVGKLAPAALSATMSACDAAVVPSRRLEGLSMSILESLANGLHVYTTPTGARGLESVSAVHVIEPKVGEFATLLARRWHQRSATSLLPETYDLSVVASRYVQVIQEVIETRRAG